MGKVRNRSTVLAFAAVLGFAAPMTLYAAGARYLDPADTPADAIPAYEIVTRVRELALDPASRPIRRGPYYVLHAFDRRGVEMRVVADAQLGDILSVAPVRPVAAYAPPRGGPRIIHVPGPEDEQATADPPDEPDAGPPDDAEDVAPAPPVRKLQPPRRRPFSSTPGPAEHRAVLSAPPPPPQARADGLTPIYPTPKFSREDKTEKFTAPPPASAPVGRD